MENLLFGVGLLAVLGAWKHVWLPSVLDRVRDKLFDLRDRDLRESFMREGLPLDHPIYKRLRDLLNGHLRHTESASIWEFFGFFFMARRSKADLFAIADRLFHSEDPRVQVIVQHVRFQSAIIMLAYMLFTSVLAIPLLALVFVVFTVIKQLPFKKIFLTRPVVRARLLVENAALTC